jgi:hypothetical protein
VIAVKFAPASMRFRLLYVNRLSREAYMASRRFQVSVTGAKSYVTGKELRSGCRKRTERCIAKVRHL